MATTATTIEALSAHYLDQLAERTPASHELRREAEQVLAGGVSSHFKAWQPFYVREAKGAHLTDVDGNDYVDLVMGFGPNRSAIRRMPSSRRCARPSRTGRAWRSPHRSRSSSPRRSRASCRAWR